MLDTLGSGVTDTNHARDVIAEMQNLHVSMLRYGRLRHKPALKPVRPVFTYRNVRKL